MNLVHLFFDKTNRMRQLCDEYQVFLYQYDGPHRVYSEGRSLKPDIAWTVPDGMKPSGAVIKNLMGEEIWTQQFEFAADEGDTVNMDMRKIWVERDGYRFTVKEIFSI